MPNTVGGSVVWNLDVDGKPLKAGLDKAKSDVSRAASDIQGSFKNASSGLARIGTTIAGFGLKLASGLALGGVAVGTFAIKSAADMQMLRSSFDVLTGSAEEGAAVFERLGKLGATTPFETKDLADATKTMLSFGLSTEQSFEALNFLGDVSLGNKDKLAGLTLAFSQMSSTGRLMGQDLLQMINQGFNPLTIIAQKTGRSMKDLKDDMAKGAISADQVTEAFKIASSEGGIFFKGMEKGAQTFSGRLSTLKDNIGITVRAIIGLSETGDVVKGGLFDRVSTGLNQLVTTFEQNRTEIIAFGSAILNNALLAVDLFVKGLVIVVAWFKEHETFIKIVVGGLLIFAAAALAAAAVAFVVANAWTFVIAAIVIKAAFMVEQIVKSWFKATEFVKTSMEGMRVVTMAIIDAIVAGFRLFFDAISMVINGVINLINTLNGLPGGVRGAVSNLWNIAREGFSNFADSARNWALETVENIVNFFGELPKRLVDMISGAISNVGNLISNFGKGLLSGIGKGLGIPGFADGVTNFRGGLALVGERGPELVNLPRGADVIPNGEFGGGQTINITNNIQNNRLTDIDALSRKLAFELGAM